MTASPARLCTSLTAASWALAAQLPDLGMSATAGSAANKCTSGAANVIAASGCVECTVGCKSMWICVDGKLDAQLLDAYIAA